ncbi:MAG: DUF4276 family protein [Planctomycetes bacterium]|nr:DUF4276 family protein [Planctomycetota bacterium]
MLCILSEGLTEDGCIRTVIKPHLAAHGVEVIHQIVDTGRRGKRRESGGGGFLHFKEHLGMWLRDAAYAHARFTTMWDLYGLPVDFPRRNEVFALQDPYEKVKRAEEFLAEQFSDERLIPYFQLHEFETMLFCDPPKLLQHYIGEEARVAQLVEIANEVGNPELINDRPDTCPSRRIEKVFKRYPKAKTTVGPKAVKWIGLPTIREKCRHFADWLGGLESLGQQGAP